MKSFLTDDQMRSAVGHVSLAMYDAWFNELPSEARSGDGRTMGHSPRRRWPDRRPAGDPRPDLRQRLRRHPAPPRVRCRPRWRSITSPDLPPTHHYLAYYRWIRDEFGADAVMHMGKHGNLEWLPGKATALSSGCYPEVMLSDLPNFYPYLIINNPARARRPSAGPTRSSSTT